MTYKLNTQKILFTQLGDEGVLYDTQTNEYISLNETLFKILKGVEDSLTIEQIVKNLCDEYRISEENCKQEVMNALSKLVEKEYIIE
nr:PqqD family protein [uncultured Emticicia sp.]